MMVIRLKIFCCLWDCFSRNIIRNTLKMCMKVYGSCWIMAWTSDWPPEVSAESAAGAQVNAISPEWPEGPPLLDPHLRADSQGGRISIWRSLLLELFCEPRIRVSSLFHYSFVSAIISLVLYLFTLQSVYLFAMQYSLELSWFLRGKKPKIRGISIMCWCDQICTNSVVSMSLFYIVLWQS